MLEEEQNVVRRVPTVVVTFDSIYGDVDLKGDVRISSDVLALLRLFKDKGFYIAVDCRDPLDKCMVCLVRDGVPYDGLMSDKHAGYVHDTERYIDRLSEHCGWENVHSVIDEDVGRLGYASRHGISAFQVMGGSIIHQSCSGKEERKVTTFGYSFPAEGATSVY